MSLCWGADARASDAAFRTGVVVDAEKVLLARGVGKGIRWWENKGQPANTRLPGNVLMFVAVTTRDIVLLVEFPSSSSFLLIAISLPPGEATKGAPREGLPLPAADVVVGCASILQCPLPLPQNICFIVPRRGRKLIHHTSYLDYKTYLQSQISMSQN